MMAFKCKMCGGDLEFAPGSTIAECPYCGSRQTLPRLDDDRRANLYDRANHFRRQNEYDKAMAIYEQILQEDRTDAEAYWSLVLCRYGIEYVEDPASHKRVPTVNRVQYDPILSDEDYQSALQYADGVQRGLYEAEAQAISEIQRGILDISKKEKPFDVFICYKETDANGRRTPDSVLANDLYYQLTNEGFKVFFSRITLEDKIGTAYEPYIFAALNSAKVMVALGTKPEYFKAVWVKNEWSRYLALIRAGADKTLVPAYRDMDPYELPEEFAHLQALDMGKLGFMQDLIRGIKKITGRDAPPPQAFAARPAATGAAPGVGSLMDRALLFMEDGDFASASEYLDRVLDIDAKFAPAYAAKTCVSLKLRKEADLAKLPYLFDDSADWQKALRFADARQKAVYEGYAAEALKRVERQERDFAYDCALKTALQGVDHGERNAALKAYQNACRHLSGECPDGGRPDADGTLAKAFQTMAQTGQLGNVSEKGLKAAAALFAEIGDEEALRRAEECRALAEQARQRDIFGQAKAAQDSSENDPAGLEKAAAIFESIPDWKNARERARQCRDKAEAIRRKLYDEAQEAVKTAGSSSAGWLEAGKKLRVSGLDGYRDVESLREQAQKRFEECTAAEEEARRQARVRAQMEKYAATVRKKRLKTIAVAAVMVVLALVFFVTQVIIPKSNYNKAVALQQAGQYEEAIAAFEALGDYGDAAEQIIACQKEQDYQAALALQQAGQYEEAIAAFEALGGYGDAAEQIKETKYLLGKAMLESGDYAGAIAVFSTIKGYKDVDELLETDDNLAAAARDAAFSVGNTVTFGAYPQTSAGNDQTPVEWLVLARDGNNALLLSKYALDAKPYNTEYTSITWEKCTLRSWLNQEFLNRAFTSEEQTAILLTDVDNSASQGYSGYSRDGGKDTKDKVFLLSYTEAWNYFGSDEARKCAPTDYAVQQSAGTSSQNTVDGRATGWWWLRSPSNYQDGAVGVNYDGSRDGNGVSSADGSVRPALWINLDSGIF